MKTRPTIFLSGVSHELKSLRDAAAAEVTRKGCFADNQSTSFPPDHRTVEAMLRHKLKDADAVIHIVGFRFGAEPEQRPADPPRRSYTQMEFDIAGELSIPVYRFVSTHAGLRDPAQPGELPEDDEAAALQRSHRDAVRAGNHLYYEFADAAELCKLVAQILTLQTSSFHADISRIVKYAPPKLIGRDAELKLLDNAWAQARSGQAGRPQVVGFVALGGEGKTSLVAHWLAGQAAQHWPGCDAVFAWSFYSQGSRETQAGSSDLFLREALIRFGAPTLADSPQSAYDKGQRLAQLVGERRALLVLDGLEPLQHAPTSPLPGELKDPGLAALLGGLAARGHGLCVLTTRYEVADLRTFEGGTVQQHALTQLSDEAGVELLQSLGVRGSEDDFPALVAKVRGHALTLNLLGTYLRDAHGGDIRRHDVVKLEKANDAVQGGHAFRVMDAYARWMVPRGFWPWLQALLSTKQRAARQEGQRALAMLCLLGLFDRPASADCLAALWQAPAIAGLTESLVDLGEAQRSLVLSRLQAARLLTVNRDTANAMTSLDAHPLLREYLAAVLGRHQPQSRREAHERLFRHLCSSTPDVPEAKLDDLLPLYQAVVHGCLAGLQQQACENVYRSRIVRSPKFYSTRNLGAFGADLSAVASFFDVPWQKVSRGLSITYQSWLLNVAAFNLHALGRLAEALQPMRVGLAMDVKRSDWINAAISAGNLSELELTLGDTAAAMRDAEAAVTHADLIDDSFLKLARRATQADALHQAGKTTQALALFEAAERMQIDHQPDYGLLYSVQGFLFCELLLMPAERSAWRVCLLASDSDAESVLTAVRAVGERATQTLAWVTPLDYLLDVSLDQLTLGRVALIESLLTNTPSAAASQPLNAAVDGLRRAGTQRELPRALLTRAWYRHRDHPTGPNSAQTDLDEAWSIAARGPMPLFQADIHLHRARLFGPRCGGPGQPPYPWTSASHDLHEARRLIEKHGYGRRLEQLRDAEAVAVCWPCHCAT